MAEPEYWIKVRNKDLKFIGEIDQFYSFNWELPWMEVGKWSLQLPFSSKGADLLLQIAQDPQNEGIGGIYVERNGSYIFSGPLEEVHEEWGENGHTITFNGTDELGIIDRFLALPHPKRFASPKMHAGLYESPDPAGDPAHHVDRYPNMGDTATHTAGEAAMIFIRDNIGESATYLNNEQPRRLPLLTTNQSNYVGASVTKSTPFRARGERLINIIQAICNFSEWNGIPIQVRGEQAGGNIHFKDMASPNRPNAIFSPELGNLREFRVSRVPPKANMVLIGGSGEGVDRLFAYAGDEPSIALHGRRESFGEYTGQEPAATTNVTESDLISELTAHVYATLNENAETTTLEIKPRDTTAVQFGRDWFPFDTVTVRIRGEETKNIIRVVSANVSDGGEDLSVVIGNQGAVSKGLRLYDRVKNLEHRYDGLNKRASGGS